ncbi:class GN sortase [Marinicella litoralis]|uniref:Sortase A n=1 Tax=Marinicella litoralis TaxID=644220 RepID=A0A4R6XLR7_9GAMM|nr:class GN sortase [Marinicella litoralis]TDR20582.1 sortase A [Marinicella litoralis]
MINTKPQSYTLAARHKSSFKAGRQSKKMWVKIIIATLLSVGSWQVGSSVYLLAKAQLAHYFIADAWQATLQEGQVHKPWDWADTHPVAKMSFPDLQQSAYVLEGANGRNMAFGPARTLTSGMPGDSLSTVISAHNDSHFSFLGQVKLNDVIQIETLKGQFNYQVTDLRVIDSSQQQININPQDELILTTCYPFNALQTGGKMRYQVTASRR